MTQQGASPDTLFQQAFSLHIEGRLPQAIELYQTILAADSNYVPALENLAAAYSKTGQLELALSMSQKAIGLSPNHASAYNNLGAIYSCMNRFDEAITAYQKALVLKPDFTDACLNQGRAYFKWGDTENALHFFHQASQQVSLRPDIQWDMALAYLLAGDFEKGLPLYESRLQHSGVTFDHISKPRWQGEDLTGKTILLHAEQGLGDTIQFVRYAKHVKQRNAEKVIVACQPSLVELIRSVAGVDEVIPFGSQLSDYHYYCPLLSLPLHFDTHASNIPNEVPYLNVSPDTKTPAVLQADGFKIGIAWTGSLENPKNETRSLQLKDFFPLLALPGVRFFSLQVGEAENDLRVHQCEHLIPNLGKSFASFTDTAAAIMQLDLVITIDTSVAHLAGALGKPVWVMLPFAPDWRWQLNREDSPWYPTMTLFRQPQPGDWRNVIEQVYRQLQNRLQ